MKKKGVCFISCESSAHMQGASEEWIWYNDCDIDRLPSLPLPVNHIFIAGREKERKLPQNHQP